MRSQVARTQISATRDRNLRKLLLNVLEEATTRGMPVGVGDRIKQARLEAGLTQDQLAELIGVGMRQVQYYEADESDPYRKLGRIAEATGKPIGWLLHGDEPTEPASDAEVLARLDAVESLLQEVLRRLPGEQDEPRTASHG